MARCPKCAADAADGVAFCGECGAHLVVGAGVAPTLPGEPAAVALGADEATASTVPGAPIAGAPPRARESAAPHAPGALVDRKYEIVRLLGEGGMGVVYLARDVHTGTEVVLKAVRAELAHRADIRERTLSEGRSLARIDHPNVVQLKAVVAEGDELWLVMQYVDGQSLDGVIAHHVTTGEPIALDEALRLFRQIVAGIAAAHAEGVIHRDLKPANVLVRKKDGVAKVTDFGIAKSTDDAREGRGSTKGIIGSVWYMSPEQVTGRRDLDERVDVYALGILLYELLVGRVPFDADSDYEIMRMQAEEPLPSVAAQRPDVPATIDAFLARACAKKREERLGSCAEVLAALDRAVEKTSRAERGESAPPSAPSGRRTALVVGGVATLALAAGAALVLGGVIPLGASPPARATSTTTAAPTAPPRATVSPSASAPAPEPSLVRSLEGTWTSENGNDFDAVVTGDAVEFRIRDDRAFAAQGYRAGEPRFTLRAAPGKRDELAVEDRLRPTPPVGKAYDAQARTTCFETFTTAAGRPLVATLEGARLRVEAAKIEPTEANFVREGDKVVSCRGLATLKSTAIVILMSRRAAEAR
jgi:serine/threonine-protein kinase